MPNQIVLAWEVDVTNTTFGPAGAAAALGAVPLYDNTLTDPVLGQMFGLTVAADVSAASGPSTATRTLTLNMAGGVGSVFPCHPRASSPPVPPYPLRKTVTLPGSFFVAPGVAVVATTETQIPSLVPGDSIQFLSQQGVFYQVLSITNATQIILTAPYTGVYGKGGAFKEVGAPITLAAIYSTSPLDTAGVATVPAIPPGSGARTVTLVYNDSTGAGPFIVTVPLTGRRPAAVVLAGGSIDIAEILGLNIASTGSFANSVGQITLVELSSALPAIPANATPGTGIGAGQGDRTFYALTDEAQMLIKDAIAYLPPSYFALAQQGSSAPQLAGDFLLTTGAKDVPTTVDQTAALAATNVIEFAAQPRTFYVVAAVTAKIVTLTTPYSGIDENFTGANNASSNVGTRGNLGTAVIKKMSGAKLIDPSPAAPPTNDQLSVPLGQFVAPGVVGLPPSSASVPPPAFLSGHFTRTLQLALAVPVVAQAITFV